MPATIPDLTNTETWADDALDALASCVEMIRKSEKPNTQIKTVSKRTKTRTTTITVEVTINKTKPAILI